MIRRKPHALASTPATPKEKTLLAFLIFERNFFFLLKGKENFFATLCSLRAGRRGFASARARRNSPHTPFSARPARASGLWRAPRAISSVQKRFGFRQTNAPQSNFQEFCRPIQPREARQRTETLARRARRSSPSAGSKSLAILSICFAQLKLTT